MKQIRIFALLVVAVSAIMSCTTASESEVTLYNDAVITDFSLGTLNRYVDGTKSYVTGSDYTFYIDQSVNPETNTRNIYNPDSLPIGTDKAHVICNLTTLNNGIAVLQDLEDPELFYYYSSYDSIDFTQPRTFRVYASDDSGYTAYTIKVNVHAQDGDIFVWEQVQDAVWPEDPILPTGIRQLLGHSTTEYYALSDDNKLKVSYDGGDTWVDDQTGAGEDATLLPTANCSLVSYPMYLADDTDYVLLAGAATGSGDVAVVWRKIVDYGNGTPGKWIRVERDDDEPFQLPALSQLQLVKYDDGILAFGGDYSKIYQSRDNGITWKENKRYQMPTTEEGFDATTTGIKVVTDDDNYIWLYCYGTGQVWRGRLNRLGWK